MYNYCANKEYFWSSFSLFYYKKVEKSDFL